MFENAVPFKRNLNKQSCPDSSTLNGNLILCRLRMLSSKLHKRQFVVKKKKRAKKRERGSFLILMLLDYNIN